MERCSRVVVAACGFASIQFSQSMVLLPRSHVCPAHTRCLERHIRPPKHTFWRRTLSKELLGPRYSFTSFQKSLHRVNETSQIPFFHTSPTHFFNHGQAILSKHQKVVLRVVIQSPESPSPQSKRSVNELGRLSTHLDRYGESSASKQ